MNAKQFSELIKDPNRIHDVDASDLKRMAHEYPYSQAIQFAYALRLKNSGEHLFNQQLGRTSIITEDRSILYDYFEKGGISMEDEITKPTIPANIESRVVKPAAKPAIEDSVSFEKGAKLDEPVLKEEMKKASSIPETPSPIKESEKAQKPEIAAPKKAIINPKAFLESDPVPDMSHLSASEKIKAILERSRKLQASFEEKKTGENEVNDRVKAIREQLEKIKSTRSEPPAPPVKAQGIMPQALPPPPVKAQDIVPQPTSPQPTPPQPKIDEEILSAIEAQEEAIQKIEKTKEKATLQEKEEEIEAPVFIIEEMDAEKKGKAYQEIKEDETHNFYDWFKRLPNTAGKKETETNSEELKLEDKIELFDSFVNKLPELKKKRNVEAAKPAEVEGKTSLETGALVTETLANVYISQGHFDKAKKAYQILKLKYPEKSSFFADRIQEIEKLKKSK